jgi:hypothetical protein
MSLATMKVGRKAASVFCVPEGRLMIAQHFSAGDRRRFLVHSPGGTTETWRQTFSRPSGTTHSDLPCNPAMNRWAIIKRPSGTERTPRRAFLTGYLADRICGSFLHD